MHALSMGPVAFVAIALASCPAVAATYTASELTYDAALLSQFNLINLGAYNVEPGNTGAVYVSGRVVAGSVTTGSNGMGNCVSGCSGNTTIGASSSITNGVTTPGTGNPAYGALTVFGNVVGNVASSSTGAASTINVGGTLSGSASAASGTFGRAGGISGANLDSVNVVGTISSTSAIRDTPTFNSSQTGSNAGVGRNTNVTTTNTGVSASTVFPFAAESTAFTTPLKSLYSGIANLPGTPGVTAQTLPSNYTGGAFASTTAYTSVVGTTTYKYGVVTTTLANLAAQSSAFTGITNGAGNNATFVIVTGDTGTLPTITNGGSNVIYDFVSAGTLTTAGNFNASILAPLANIVNTTGNINGTVVVASMTESQALYNTNVFTGDLTGLRNLTYNSRVPEPASLALIGVGVVAAAIARRRRK